VDELAKVVLIFIGTFPFITRDIYLEVKKIPKEQIIKSLTLGASQFAVTYRVVVPQIIPKLIDTIRLNMGPAWLFLIASEAIAATSGLGYRIFLVRRYLAMDIIIPYVLWIVLIGFTVDWLLRKTIHWRYSWYLESGG
jgi:NitT/TauT family transport system permease protein